ncbi:MAG: DNA topoisomerase VI subunit B [Planctomycetes bacterium]|nr:DNA topoisomerase VI subunit B [Planctomycetota bacterium]
MHAEELAKKQREISVSEFFAKNRHLLGFDNPRKALLTCVKEAVDNSLDACEEARILPEVRVTLRLLPGTEDRYVVAVEDNGPGIVREQIPRVFGKLLYGSKFHRLRMSRGQQGIGIAAAGMYSLLTTGKPMKIWSRTGEKKPAHYVELQIETSTNEPNLIRKEEVAWEKVHGTKVEIEIVGKYQKGRLSVDEYLEQTAIANPHATFVYVNPEGDKREFRRAVEEFPREPKEIKPHPYGVELGVFMKMLQDTKARTLSGFLQSDFSRVSSSVAAEICRVAAVSADMKPSKVAAGDAEKVHKAIPTVKIMNPPTDVLSPIGEANLLKGLHQQVQAEFYTAVTRPPSVYRGNPFAVEVALAYGVKDWPPDDLVRVLRFANRVPLLYQAGSCAITEAILDTKWKNYGVSQSKGALPAAPMAIALHFASVWVPFTSESKEAVAHYDAIIKEMKLAIQEAGRRVYAYVRRRQRDARQLERRSLFERYIEEVADACALLTKVDRQDLMKRLQAMAEQATKLHEREAAKEEKNDNGDEVLKGTTTLVVPENAQPAQLELKPAAQKA